LVFKYLISFNCFSVILYISKIIFQENQMKKIQLSVLALFACTNLVMAGGDINPITPYEIEDVQLVEVTPVVQTLHPSD